MAGIKPLLDRARTYITRYHNTTPRGAYQIIESGSILPTKSFGATKNPAVFTTASKTAYHNRGRTAQFELDIPKEWYKEHSVFDERDYPRNQTEPYLRYNSSPFDDFEEKASTTVYNGGRTSLFDTAVPIDYVKRVCFDTPDGGRTCIEGPQLRRSSR